MSLAIFSIVVVPLPGLSLGSTYSSGVHSSDAPKRERGFLHFRTSIKIPAFPVKAYRDKPDYGDLDILVPVSPGIDFRSLSTPIVSALGSERTHINGSVVSLPVETGVGKFQVDLIFVQEKDLESSEFYFSYNDLGNLIGKIYHRLGFKLGNRGLLYVVRSEANYNHVLKEIRITNHPKTILALIGLDYARYLSGFDSLEDVFWFVSSSPYFNRSIFDLSTVNHIARVRDRKRKTYHEFLKWVNDPEKAFPERDVLPKKELRKKFLVEIFSLFPPFKTEYDDHQIIDQENQVIAKKFNGEVVEKLTGLKEKDLGLFIKKFKTKGFREWVLRSSQTLIETSIVLSFLQDA